MDKLEELLADMSLTRLKQQEAEQSLRRSEERFRTMFENSSDVIAIINPDGTARFVSPSIKQLLGYHPHETEGLNIFDLVHPDEIPLAMTEFSALHAEPGMSRKAVYRHKASDGTWRICETVGRNLLHDPTIQGFLFNVRDITERHKAEEEIVALNAILASRAAALEDSNRELETFGYSLSHDLKNPIARIQMCAEMLRSDYAEQLGTNGRDLVDYISEASLTMDGLISALLDLSHLAQTEINCAEVDLGKLASMISQDLQATEPERQVEFVLEPKLPVHGDPVLLKVVLENLIGNAWKYTSRVSCARIEFGAVMHDGERVFFVRDNGAGFSMQEVGKIFQPFQRLHQADEFTGSGIGLATVQRIIHRHGGRIWAEGVCRMGATFYFTLP